MPAPETMIDLLQELRRYSFHLADGDGMPCRVARGGGCTCGHDKTLARTDRVIEILELEAKAADLQEQAFDMAVEFFASDTEQAKHACAMLLRQVGADERRR